MLTYNQSYYITHREKLKQRSKEYLRLNYASCLERKRKYRESHREELRQKARQYRIKNIENITAWKKRNVVRLSEYGKKYMPRWKKENPEKCRRSKQSYKARRRVAGDITVLAIQNVYEQNIKHFGTLTCYLCLKPIEFGQDSLDHVIPLAKGGTNSIENLQIAHKVCNSRKRTRTLEEYIHAYPRD